MDGKGTEGRKATPVSGILRCFLALAAVIAVCGCMTGIGTPEQVLSGTGTITFVPEDGGFYGIVTEDGTRYRPLNLDDPYRAPGVRVIFAGKVRSDRIGIGQWGLPVDLITIRPADPGARALNDSADDGTLTLFGRIIAPGDGGYAILGDDGTVYLPDHIDPVYRKEGLYVVFSGNLTDSGNDSGAGGTGVALLEIAPAETPAPPVTQA
ncbi:MAG: hypothetical protein APR53_03805 [Methanoculleus sp. SDB]|nr:MAG: hypothetical protein APR53_03805 [Methanoculleus sp. SDB]